MNETPSQQDFDGNAENKKYEFETRSHSMLYARKLESHLSGLYYLML